MRRAGLALGLLLAAAACGSSDSGNPVTDAAHTMEAQGSARVTLVSTVGAKTSRESLGIDFDHGRASIVTPTGEVRYIGDTMYLRVAPGQWVKGTSSHSSLTAIDPRTLLQRLAQDAHDVRDEGKDALGGVETTHYRLAVFAKDSGSGFAVGKAGTTVPLDVWVDGDGLVRLLRGDYTAAAGKPAHVEWRFSDFGTAVRVEPPPADQVSDGPVGVAAG